jgi:hypothetical protein
LWPAEVLRLLSPSLSVRAFFERREQECDEAGVEPRGDYWNKMVAEEAGDPSRGRILGSFALPWLP